MFRRRTTTRRRASPVKRKETYKRTAYKRASTKRQYVSKKRAFTGGAGPPVMTMLVNPRTLPDCEMMWMTTTQNTVISYTAAGNLHYATGNYQFSMNDIYTPSGTTAPMTMPPVSGFAAQNALFGQWQVREAIITVKVEATNQNTSGTITVPVTDWMIVPISSSNFTAFAPLTTQSWNQCKCQPHRTLVKTFETQSSPQSVITLRKKLSPHQLVAVPEYYGLPGTIGSSYSAPTDQSFFNVMWLQPTIGSTGQEFTFTVTIAYAVRWFNRNLTALSVEPPSVEQVKASLGAPVKGEGKEELKRMPDDDGDDDSFEFGGLTLSTPSHTLKRTESAPIPWTCLNPLHKGDHIRASTCV